VFPDQVACGENIVGDIVVPDHPLVRQTVRDCLEEAMDVDGFEQLLHALIENRIRIAARDLTEPSPLALEVLSARPYAYLDDAPLEERRTQAVMSRRWMDPESAADIGRLDPEAIARVRSEAWPEAGSADELHDALCWLTFLNEAEVQREPAWPALVHDLITQRRVASSGQLLVAAERIPLLRAVFPQAAFEPDVAVAGAVKDWARDEALREIVRGRLEGLGPTTAGAIATALGVDTSDIDAALLALEAEGSAMRGNFEPDNPAPVQWCDRRLLARVHRYTVKRLRAEIEPVQARDFLRFLFEWQRVTPGARMQGPDSVAVCWVSWKDSMRPRAPGKPRCSPRASRSTTPRGSTSNVSPAASSGRVSQLARAMPSAVRHRCARHRSLCWRDAMSGSGRH
jgi:ATP-dependent Lhr-like helicase